MATIILMVTISNICTWLRSLRRLNSVWLNIAVHKLWLLLSWVKLIRIACESHYGSIFGISVRGVTSFLIKASLSKWSIFFLNFLIIYLCFMLSIRGLRWFFFLAITDNLAIFAVWWPYIQTLVWNGCPLHTRNEVVNYQIIV